MKIDIDEFVAILEIQSINNDGKLSEDEQNIINSVKELYQGSTHEIYSAVLKAAYKDNKLTCGESDLINLTRDLLQISSEKHQEALFKINFQ